MPYTNKEINTAINETLFIFEQEILQEIRNAQDPDIISALVEQYKCISMSRPPSPIN